jgi:hypothetical protein
MMRRHCCISPESYQTNVMGFLRNLIFGSNQDSVSIKTPRKPTSGSGFSKWSARLDTPSTEVVHLKKWPWFSRKPIETIQFKYEDRNGDYSIRTVDVFATTHFYLMGYCYHRNANRTFKIGRIQGLVTIINTGEMMNSHQWALVIYSHPKNDHQVDLE